MRVSPNESNAPFRLESWCEDLESTIAQRTVAQLVLPGSHDSGAYSCGTVTHGPCCGARVGAWAPAWLKHPLSCLYSRIAVVWSTAQPDDIFSQLSIGVRYLDIRVCYDPVDKLLRTEHSVLGTTIEDILSQIAAYIKGYSKEIIIVHLRKFRLEGSHDMSPAHHRELVDLVEKTLD